MKRASDDATATGLDDRHAGVASIVPPIGILVLLVGDGSAVELLGPWLLVAPVTGVVATFAALFMVYKGKPLGWAGLGWVVLLGLLWFVALPLFWYQKIYRPWTTTT